MCVINLTNKSICSNFFEEYRITFLKNIKIYEFFDRRAKVKEKKKQIRDDSVKII